MQNFMPIGITVAEISVLIRDNFQRLCIFTTSWRYTNSIIIIIIFIIIIITIENHGKNGKNHGRHLQNSRKSRQDYGTNSHAETWRFYQYACAYIVAGINI